MDLTTTDVRGRMVCFIPGTDHVEGHGFRVAFVVEGEDGYRPTGTWPYTGAVGETLPWFWGPTLAEAEAEAARQNEAMGITPDEAAKIVVASMEKGCKASRRGSRRVSP